MTDFETCCMRAILIEHNFKMKGYFIIVLRIPFMDSNTIRYRDYISRMSIRKPLLYTRVIRKLLDNSFKFIRHVRTMTDFETCYMRAIIIEHNFKMKGCFIIGLRFFIDSNTIRYKKYVSRSSTRKPLLSNKY